jgi:hypothetical protein
MLRVFLLGITAFLLAGCAPSGVQSDPGATQPDADHNTVVDQTGEERTAKIPELLKRLCAEKDEIGLSGYEGTTPRGRGGEVLLCGEYVRVSSPLDLMDAPSVIFDFAGKRVGSCGGMPKPGSTNAPACELDCEQTGLYFCGNN